jgi:hypothetical protein
MRQVRGGVTVVHEHEELQLVHLREHDGVQPDLVQPSGQGRVPRETERKRERDPAEEERWNPPDIGLD